MTVSSAPRSSLVHQSRPCQRTNLAASHGLLGYVLLNDMTFPWAGSPRHCVEPMTTQKDTPSGHPGPRHPDTVQCLKIVNAVMETAVIQFHAPASRSYRTRLRLQTAVTLPHGSWRLPLHRWIFADPPPASSSPCADQVGYPPQESAGVRARADPPANRTPGGNRRPHLQPGPPGPLPRHRSLSQRFSRWREPAFFLMKVGLCGL